MGLGFILYANDLQKFLSKANLGIGSNNQGELLACYYLLKLLFQNNFLLAQIYGYYSLMINHLNGIVRITSLSLHTYAHLVLRAVGPLHQGKFDDVYIENNLEADQRSKAGLLLNLGSFSLIIMVNGRELESVGLIQDFQFHPFKINSKAYLCL